LRIVFKKQFPFLGQGFKPLYVGTVDENGLPITKVMPSKTRTEQFVTIDEYFLQMNRTLTKSLQIIQGKLSLHKGFVLFFIVIN